MRRRSGRRSFVLVAVMIITGSALFIASALLYVLRSDAAVAAGALDVAQARSLGWSGMQIVIAELHRQRERILDGESPRLEPEYIVFETGSEIGVVRLLPLGPAGELLVPEAGKLDLNEIDADALEKTTLIDAATARAIIAYRAARGGMIQSVAELLAVDGVTPELLYGPLEDLNLDDQAQEQVGDVADRLLDQYTADAVRGLADVVTVYGFEPALQQNGKLRIDLHVEWSDELRDRVADRFGEEIATALKQIIDNNFRFDTEAKLFQLLRFFNVEPEEWREAIDTFTAEPNEYHKGRLDINTASYEALLALPGIDPDQAAAMVDARDGLSREERASVAWPAILKIVPPEAYDDLAGRITTRCWTWRVRLAAGIVSADDPDGLMRSPVIYEAVIDLSAPRPRLAYLRDVGLLQTTVMIAANVSSFKEEFDDVNATAQTRTFSSDENDEAGDAEPDFGFQRNRGGETTKRPRDSDNSMRGARPEDDADEQDVTPAPAPPPPPRRVGRWKPGG